MIAIEFLKPRNWPILAGLFVAWCVAYLPFYLQLKVGSALGYAVYHLSKRRRDITQKNLKACFPEKSTSEIESLTIRSFKSNGKGAIEGIRTWFRSPEGLADKVSLHGLEILEEALKESKGVILFGGHFSTLDIAGSLTTLFFRADVMQRDHSNPIFNHYMTRSRAKLYERVLGKRDLRGLLKSLRDNHVVWYATDQDAGNRNVVFAPFFGHPAATLRTTMKLAEKTGAAIVPFSHFRRPGTQGYDLYIHEPLPEIPSSNDMDDASRLNQFLEQEIRRHPEQYLWMHRRFKTRPSADDDKWY